MSYFIDSNSQTKLQVTKLPKSIREPVGPLQGLQPRGSCSVSHVSQSLMRHLETRHTFFSQLFCVEFLSLNMMSTENWQRWENGLYSV